MKAASRSPNAANLRRFRTLSRQVRQELTGFARAPSARGDPRPFHGELRRGEPRERVHVVQQLDRVIVASHPLVNFRESSVDPGVPWLQFERSVEANACLVEPPCAVQDAAVG